MNEHQNNSMHTESNTKQKCLVVGFGDYTIRLFSNELKKHIEFIPVEYYGMDLATDAIDFDTITIPSILKKIESARLKCGSSKVAVLGFSFGGMVALDYALEYPKNVSRIITVCSPPCWTETYKQSVQAFQKDDLSVERASILAANKRTFQDEYIKIPPNQRFIKYTVVQAPLYWYDPHYDESKNWDDLSVNLDVVNYIDSKVYKEHDQTHKLVDIVSPVFMAFGRFDYATPYNSWVNYRTSIRDLSEHVFDRSSHHPMIEEQSKFDQLLIDWIYKKQHYYC
jgi:proline iminopeptidase